MKKLIDLRYYSRVKIPALCNIIAKKLFRSDIGLVIMFPSFALGVVVATLAQPTAGHSSMVSSNYYHLITIEASSWNDVATFTMANTG